MDKLWCSLIEDEYNDDDQLYHLLSDVLVRLQTIRTFPPEACGKLLNILDEHHSPLVYIVTCTLLSCLCNLSGSVKGDLVSRGAVSSLVCLLKITIGEFSCASTSSLMYKLHSQLIEHITSMLLYFSVGKSLAVKKLLRGDIFSTLVSVIDANSRLLSLDSREAVDTLKSLIAVERKLVGRRQEMISGAAEYVCRSYLGSECVSKVITSEPFIIDMFDTSTNEDVHIVDRMSELCGSDKVWLYDDADDPEIDDPETQEDIWVDVYVTHIINAGYFWAVLGHSEKETFDAMHEELRAALVKMGQHEFMATTTEKSEFSVVSMNLQTGQLVCVLHQTLGWYRAQVIQIVGKGSVRVFAIDYGFSQTVSVAELHIPDNQDPVLSHLCKLPALSHLCKLKGVRPVPTSRDIFISVLGTLCNLTGSEDFWSKLETDAKNFAESGLPAKLFHLVNCPDVEMQIMTLQIYSNLARTDVLRPLVMESGVCQLALDVINKNKKHSQTPQWTELIKTCLHLISHLFYNCNENRNRFIKLQGLHTLGQLCYADFPEDIKRSAAKAVKLFIGEAHVGVDFQNSRGPPCATPVNNFSARKFLLDFDDEVDGAGDGTGISCTEIVLAAQESQRLFNLNERLALHSDQCNELQTEPVEKIDRDAFVRLICAFLNSQSGGSIYYGLQPLALSDRCDCIVRGVRLSQSVRDRLRVSVDKLVIQKISPAVAPGTIITNMHPVLEPKTKEPIADLRVVEISVKRPPFHYSMPTLHTCKYGIERRSFVRMNCLTKQLSTKPGNFQLNEMLLGSKVVRGPDWKWKYQDNGEGTVGTVVKYGSRRSKVIVNDTVFVQWDTGGFSNYRVGRDGAFDLRLYDTAIAGSSHPDHSCCECEDKVLVGIRWTCATCENVSLCSACYGSDKHSLSHRFIRYDWPSSVGFKVPTRLGSRKVEASGIFAGAMVTRGPDWRWDNQDGGPGNRGFVLQLVLDPASNSWRSICEVAWPSGVTNQYRNGHEGKVDLLVAEPGVGASYYPDHLALLGQEGSLPISGYKHPITRAPDGSVRPTVGSWVQINLDQDVFEMLQQGHGGWNQSMITLIGCTGRVKKVIGDDIHVYFEEPIGHLFYLNVAVASPVTRRLRSGDIVRISEDRIRVMQLQERHGGWIPQMAEHLGKTGTVVSDDNNINVRVSIDDRPWTYCPGSVTLVTPAPDGESSGDKISSDSAEFSSDDSNIDSDDDNSVSISSSERHKGVMRYICGVGLVNAALLGDISQVQAGLLAGSDGGIEREHLANALNGASLKGHVEIVKLLLSIGVASSEKDAHGNAAVHSAVIENHPEVLVVLKESSTGCDLNVTNVEGLTALHLAVIHGHIECVEQLLKLGCDPNTADPNGTTPLHTAIPRQNNRVIDLLTRTLVRFNFESTTAVNGWTVLHYAADANSSYAVERIVERAPFLIDSQNKDGITALHLAAQAGHFEVVNILVQKGKANLDMMTVKNQTALFFAVQQGSTSVIEFIVSKGGAVDCPDSGGNTPLHTALSRCRQETASVSEPTDMENAKTISEIMSNLPKTLKNPGWIAISCLLVKFGADFGWSNTSGQTPFDSLSEDRAIVDIMIKCIDNKRFTQQCQKCSVRRVMATLLPCGHHAICQDCAKKESQCLTCRKEIKDVFSPEASSVGNRPKSEKIAGSTPDRWPCETCFKQRNFMFIPCQHTCCTECKDKIGPKCPFCNKLIRRPFVTLFASSFY